MSHDQETSAQPHPRRRWLVGIALLALLAIVGAEAVLRWGFDFGEPPLARTDPITEYELIGPAEYRRWGNRISINAAGMRGVELTSTPAVSERRVLLIGDSVVYGGHRLDQSETISARLTELLRDDPGLAGCDAVVLPMAVSSWGPANQAAFLQRDGHFDADSAAIVVSAHDLYDVPDWQRNTIPYRLEPSRTAIGDVVQIIRDRIGTQGNGSELTERASQQDRTAISLAALDQMADQLAQAGVDTVLVYHPTVGELTGLPADARAVFLGWAAERGIEVLDLGAAGADPTGYRDVIHPNALGAERLAADLAAFVGPSLAACNGS